MLLSVSVCRRELWLNAPNVLTANSDRVRFPLWPKECRIYCDRAVGSCGLATQVWGGLRGFLRGWVDSLAVRRFGDRLGRGWFLRGLVPEVRDPGLPGDDAQLLQFFAKDLGN